MNAVRKLDHWIHFLAQRRYLVPTGLVLAGLILLSLVISSSARKRKRGFK